MIYTGMARLTSREKDLVASTFPCYSGYATKEELKAAKLKARGHYWHDMINFQFCAVSVKGRKKYFEYCHHPGQFEYTDCICSSDEHESNFYLMKTAAKEWAKH